MSSLTDPRVPESADRDTDEHRTAVLTLALAFKSAMGAVRRLRGLESHRPGELSYAQCGVRVGSSNGYAASATGGSCSCR